MHSLLLVTVLGTADATRESAVWLLDGANDNVGLRASWQLINNGPSAESNKYKSVGKPLFLTLLLTTLFLCTANRVYTLRTASHTDTDRVHLTKAER